MTKPSHKAYWYLPFSSRLLLISLTLTLALALGCVPEGQSFKPLSGLFHPPPAKEQPGRQTDKVNPTAPQQQQIQAKNQNTVATTASSDPQEEPLLPDSLTNPASSNSESSNLELSNSGQTNSGFNSGLIDKPSCIKGLTGNLSTGRAGRNFLDNFGNPRTVASETLNNNNSIAALALDQAPSSNKSLRLHSELTGQLLFDAYGQTGRPFRSGGKTPQTGFDDAGLIQWIYSQEGVKIPPTVKEQVANGQAVTRDDLRPGDILVYKTPKAIDYLVGIYTGNGNFILASNKLDVVTETAAFGTDYGPYFVGGRRYIDDPSAAPLSNELKSSAANGAVKLALSAMGDNIPKPTNIYGGSPKKPTKKARSRRSSKRTSGKKI
jgi:cell wall-associated NlpC family hydrolase